MTWVAFLLLAATGQQLLADPADLVGRARLLALSDRPQAESLLRQAVAQYEKQASQSLEYASALDLLGMLVYLPLASDKEALQAQVEPLFAKALAIYKAAPPDAPPAGLALALELESMALEKAGRLEDSRDPKARARALRDQIISALQVPAEAEIAGSTHLSPALQPPALLARSEPQLTFEAKLLKIGAPDVLAEVIIGTDGLLHNIEIFRPAGFGLDESAVRALLAWRFQPARKNGVPIPVEGNIKLRFHP